MTKILLTVLAMALASSAATAQTAGRAERARRDTSRMAMEHRRDELLARLDSLRREFDEEPLSAAQRGQLARQLSSLVSSLAQLAVRSAQMNGEFDLEMTRAGEDMARATSELSRIGVLGMHITPDVLPSGWIGINVDAPQANEIRGNQFYVRYFQYPEIVSVEPNSPAERAGIAAGDVLLAYNGDDVRQRAINITRLLRPNARLEVKVRREGEGDPRVFAITVARAPAQFRERRLLVGTPAVPTVPDMPPMPSMPAPRARPAFPPLPAEAVTPPPLVEMQSMLGRAIDGATAPIAGARVVDVRNEDLARALGARQGVLVVDVVPGPAASSGLRGGDVIVRAGGEPVTSVRQLRRIVERRSGDGELPLVLVRSHREQRVTLRW